MKFRRNLAIVLTVVTLCAISIPFAGAAGVGPTCTSSSIHLNDANSTTDSWWYANIWLDMTATLDVNWKATTCSARVVFPQDVDAFKNQSDSGIRWGKFEGGSSFAQAWGKGNSKSYYSHEHSKSY